MTFFDEFTEWLTSKSALRDILIVVVAVLAAYWLSWFLARGIIRIAQKVAVRSDEESNDVRAIKLRQTETYLSVATAIVRLVVVVAVGYVAWVVINPFSASRASSSIAAIGAGTFFALIAGQTLGIVLRDLTAGSVMIAENWYKIGDFIKVEPYGEVEGVVERFTLRSTRLRALNGELIIINNQNITGVHIAPNGLRTIAVDIFVRDKERGLKEVKKVIDAIPRGVTMLAKPLRIRSIEKWGENRWRITVVGQTAPGREWLIENFFVEALVDIDEGKVGSERLLVLPPMPRNADTIADKRFKRAVRTKQE